MSKSNNNPLKEDLDHILKHTGELWEELRNKKIFITGGTGFFGCWLLESFIWINDKIGLNADAVVLTRNYESFYKKSQHLATHPNLTFHIGDVCDFKFPKGEFTHIIHAATDASSQLQKQNSRSIFDAIRQGTRRTLDFAVSCGTRKFLLTSSGAVYGKQPPKISHINENYKWKSDPSDTPYCMGKREAETLCIRYSEQYDIKIKIGRCFAFVGPYLPLNIQYAIGNFIRDGITGAPISVKGDGKSYRSYLYAADLTIWLWKILFNGRPSRPYNVGSEYDLSINDLANSVANIFNPSTEVIILQPSKRTSMIERYVPSVERVKRDLGVREWIGLNDSIKKTAKWYL